MGKKFIRRGSAFDETGEFPGNDEAANDAAPPRSEVLARPYVRAPVFSATPTGEGRAGNTIKMMM
jgi:hypothetical protein